MSHLAIHPGLSPISQPARLAPFAGNLAARVASRNWCRKCASWLGTQDQGLFHEVGEHFEKGQRVSFVTRVSPGKGAGVCVLPGPSTNCRNPSVLEFWVQWTVRCSASF